MLDADGKRVAATACKWELMRLETSWQWYRRDGNWNYEPVTITRKIASGTVDATPDATAKIAAKVGWGRYRLEVALPIGRPRLQLVFSAGWSADDAADSPEKLDVALDKATYKAGETAKLRIASKQAGRALIAVLGTGLTSRKEVDLPKGGGEVPMSRRQRLGPRRLRHRHALPADGREGQAHAEPRHRPAVAGPRPGAAHAEGRP